MTPDGFETAVVLLSVIVIMATGITFTRERVRIFILMVGLLMIAYFVILFYDRQEAGQANEEKLKAEKDKWQDSETADR